MSHSKKCATTEVPVDAAVTKATEAEPVHKETYDSKTEAKPAASGAQADGAAETEAGATTGATANESAATAENDEWVTLFADKTID
jgi:hypothetical protein